MKKIDQFVTFAFYILIILVGALVFMYSVSLYVKIITSNQDKTFVGKIIDFEISAGGLGHYDLCKVITNETTVVCRGAICENLEVGKSLYRIGNKCVIK